MKKEFIVAQTENLPDSSTDNVPRYQFEPIKKFDTYEQAAEYIRGLAYTYTDDLKDKVRFTILLVYDLKAV